MTKDWLYFNSRGLVLIPECASQLERVDLRVDTLQTWPRKDWLADLLTRD